MQAGLSYVSEVMNIRGIDNPRRVCYYSNSHNAAP